MGWAAISSGVPLATSWPPSEPASGPTAGVMIDTIAYTPEGEVQVGGRGAVGASLRLYLDNAEKTTLKGERDQLRRLLNSDWAHPEEAQSILPH